MAKSKRRTSAKGKNVKMSRVKKSNINANKKAKRGSSTAVADSSIKKRANSWKGSAIRPSRSKEFAKEGKKVWQKRPEEKEIEIQEEGEEESDVDEQYETLQSEEIEYLKKLSEGEFLKGIDREERLTSKKSRKSKARDHENVLFDFEKMPRMLEEQPEEERKQMKQMLPIKDAEGLKRQWREADEPEDGKPKEEEEAEDEKVPDAINVDQEGQKSKAKGLPEISTVQLFAARQQKLAVKKREIAAIASSLTEDPEKHVKKLKTLRQLIAVEDPDVVVTVRKLGMVSMTELFKDIVPSYRVRDWAQEEETVKLSKEVKEKREFEECLLTNYKKFLEFLEETVTNSRPSKRNPSQKTGPNKKRGILFELPQTAKNQLALVACKCLCDLMLNLAHFNYRVNIISLVVDMMFYSYDPISDTSINCMCRFFRQHKVDDGIPEAVNFISKKIKGRHFKVPSKILDSFLHLRIKETNLRKEENQESNQKMKQERKEKMNKMTRTEKRFQKRQEALESEQREAVHEQDEKKIIQLNTRVIQSVFATYFRVLKTATDSRLMPSVLEGLAKFAHLINIEFFDDLIKVLNELIGSGALEYRESLHCVLTAFKILSDQGAALNIDPTRFYTHLYTNLFSVHAGDSFQDAAIVLKCMDAMVFKRHKQITSQRALAYIKRLGTISLQSLPNACLAFLSVMRAMLKLYPKTDILLDSETLGSGVFLPELEEPEHCHAQNTALWELHLLKNHFHPTVKIYANNLVRKVPIKGVGALDPTLSKMKPLELYEDFDPSSMVFNPPVLTKPLNKVTRSKIYAKRNFDEFLQPDFQLIAQKALEETTLPLSPRPSGKKHCIEDMNETAREKRKKIKTARKEDTAEPKKMTSKLAGRYMKRQRRRVHSRVIKRRQLKT